MCEQTDKSEQADKSERVDKTEYCPVCGITLAVGSHCWSTLAAVADCPYCGETVAASCIIGPGHYVFVCTEGHRWDTGDHVFTRPITSLFDADAGDAGDGNSGLPNPTSVPLSSPLADVVGRPPPSKLWQSIVGQQVMVDVGRQGVGGQIGQTILADCVGVDDRGLWLSTPTPTGFVGDGQPFYTLVCWPTVRALTFSPTCGLVADRGEGSTTPP